MAPRFLVHYPSLRANIFFLSADLSWASSAFDFVVPIPLPMLIKYFMWTQADTHLPKGLLDTLTNHATQEPNNKAAKQIWRWRKTRASRHQAGLYLLKGCLTSSFIIFLFPVMFPSPFSIVISHFSIILLSFSRFRFLSLLFPNHLSVRCPPVLRFHVPWHISPFSLHQCSFPRILFACSLKVCVHVVRPGGSPGTYRLGPPSWPGLWKSMEIIGCQRIINEWSMDKSLIFNGNPLMPIWIIHRWSMDSPWIIHW